MQLTESERGLLEAAEICGRAEIDGSAKCDRVIRFAMRTAGLWTQEAEDVMARSRYNRHDVGRFYNGIRTLVRRGLLVGKGDLGRPADPYYTECAITKEGDNALEAARGDAKPITD